MNGLIVSDNFTGNPKVVDKAIPQILNRVVATLDQGVEHFYYDQTNVRAKAGAADLHVAYCTDVEDAQLVVGILNTLLQRSKNSGE
jgi:hypothetical protein